MGGNHGKRHGTAAGGPALAAAVLAFAGFAVAPGANADALGARHPYGLSAQDRTGPAGPERETGQQPDPPAGSPGKPGAPGPGPVSVRGEQHVGQISRFSHTQSDSCTGPGRDCDIVQNMRVSSGS